MNVERAWLPLYASYIHKVTSRSGEVWLIELSTRRNYIWEGIDINSHTALDHTVLSFRCMGSLENVSTCKNVPTTLSNTMIGSFPFNTPYNKLEPTCTAEVGS